MKMTQKIDSLIQKFFNQEQKWQIDLLAKWNTILGPLHTKVQLEKIDNDTLVLGVFDSCWMQELYLLSPLLLKTINESLDQPRIKQLRFKKIVSIKKQEAKQKNSTSLTKKCTSIELSPQEKKALAAIEDQQLQQALRNFLIRCYQEQ